MGIKAAIFQQKAIDVTFLHEPQGMNEVVTYPAWNYKQLPPNHPERIRIEQMFEKIKPAPRPAVVGKWRNER